MVEAHFGILNDHVQHLFAICQQILLNSGIRENSRLTARNPCFCYIVKKEILLSLLKVFILLQKSILCQNSNSPGVKNFLLHSLLHNMNQKCFLYIIFCKIADFKICR